MVVVMMMTSDLVKTQRHMLEEDFLQEYQNEQEAWLIQD